MRNKETIYKLINLLKGNGRKVSVIIFFLLISSLISIISPLISKNIMDKGFLSNNKWTVIYYSLLAFALVVIDNVIDFSKEKIRVALKAEITYKLFNKSFCKLREINLSELNKTNNTELLNNIHSDISNISMIGDGVFFTTITQIFNIIGGIIGLSIISWKLTLLVMCFIPIKFFAINKLTKDRKQMVNDYMLGYSQFASWFGDTLGGIKEIRIFGLFDKKMNEFDDMQNMVIDLEKKMTIQNSFNSVFDNTLQSFITTSLYIIGANMVFNLSLTIGSIVSFIAYVAYCINPISSLFNLGLVLASIFPSAKRYYKFLDMNSEAENNGIIPLNEEMKNRPQIKFENVFFSYDGKSENNILKDINFQINTGDKVAIIGLNGAGKSTIVNLLMRFYKPTGGKIFINEEDVNDINISDYRKNISIVSQDSYLFNDTIKNNICFYKIIEHEKFKQILKDCNLYEFYESLPRDYKIGENGCFLSGGQRQKIFIARALATNNNLIILDEATANVDIDTEMQINELISTKLTNKTMIVISHKPSILRYMDKIIVLEDGKVSDIGDHNRLLKESRVYNDILINR
ncbi:ABC transporter ATP-binding protein [Clostridium saccharobutylicum]|uniref:Lipid A export ATP-binding/permease protein MsbA n=2 Tax=Clostridium saccharobutylicum TaxID=169679 RepID=U5MYT8_CLOSA|nr:ABC transporter ATP-binding protein [Clostridium saccharobutylicum]AGX44667.1 lipid A export ATP-binding/permease protein MsbA [Clostridium saccharobutylicum DSM 13864]AQR91956.1 putative ABC transporter ATP-binding protein [Clostridium saccharobutylicum]AQS01858.1 putative ABC transporter ATP-binding protein [Clostridium saccharobutylicum]AQS11456.1 putative ABC transporter ATP-binding protein [Clostridium saccharobutylicum]AQS15841.1 putative ABC transporter ATP-binding protein [Clostridi